MTKVALITGCSEPSSLGANLAVELKRRGYRVFATARNVRTMKGLKTAGCELLPLDVTSSESIAAAVAAVTEAAGRLDLLVNNAGIAGPGPLLDTDISRARDMFEVNALGLLAVTQGFAPLLVKAATPSAPAVVINIGSVASAAPPFLAAYGASKAAAHAISDALRLEMYNLNVRVVTIELGMVATAMAAGEKRVNITKTTPSGFYSNFDEIDKLNDKVFSSELSKAPSPEVVARQIADAVSGTPPPKLWLGSNAWAFRFIWPWLPVRLTDYAFRRLRNTDKVISPGQ